MGARPSEAADSFLEEHVFDFAVVIEREVYIVKSVTMISVRISLKHEMMELVGKGRLMLIEGDWGDISFPRLARRWAGKGCFG